MISIKRIKAKNVLIFDSIDVILDLNKIVVVRGDNQRSVKGDTNGVGKSVLFDLVPSVIYGITSLNIKLNEMVKNPGFVTIVFDNSGIEYEVTVSNKSGIKYQVRINGIDQEVHTIANARSILSRAWSIKESEYWSIWNLNTNFNSQLLLRGSSKQRLDFFVSFFDLTIYDKLKVKFRSDLKFIQTVEIEYNTIQSEIQNIRQDISQLVKPNTTGLDMYDDLVHVHDNLDLELRKLQHEVNLISRFKELKRLKQDSLDLQYLLDLEPKMLKYQESMQVRGKILDRLDVLKTRYLSIKSQLKGCNEVDCSLILDKYQVKYEKLDQFIMSQQVVNGRYSILDSKLGNYNRALFTAPNLKRANDELAIYTSTIDLYSKLNGATSEECPVCGTGFDIERLRINVELANVKLTKIKKFLYLYSLHAEISTLKYVDLEVKISRLNDLKYKIARLKLKQQEYMKFSSLGTELETIKKEAEHLKSKLPSEQETEFTMEQFVKELEIAKTNEKINRQLDSLRIQLTNVKYNPVVLLDSKIQEFESIKQDVKRLSQVRRIHDVYVSNHAMLVSKGRDLSKRTKDLRIKLEDKRILESLVDAYSSKGIKIQKIQSISQLLTDNLNKYRYLLFSEPFEFSIDITETRFDIFVDRKPLKSDIRSMSKSEGNRFNLLLMLSLLPLTKNRVGTIVLDEMDSGFSELNRELFRNKFLPTLHRTVPNVIVVTPDLDAYPKSTSITVKKDYNGRTHVS